MLTPEANDKVLKFVEELNNLVIEFVNQHSDEIGELFQSHYGSLVSNKQTPAISAAIYLLKAAQLQNMVNAQVTQTPVKRNIKWAASGAAKAAKALTMPETEESKARLEVCKGCEEWTGKSCKVCGCFVSLKVKIPEEKCPKGKW